MGHAKAGVYYRKSERVEAIRITEENILLVAEDVGGEYDDRPNNFAMDGNKPVPHIAMTNAKAFVGDWIVKLGENIWQVCTDEEFRRHYWAHSERINEDQEYARIYLLVRSAMNKQDTATYYGDSTGMDHVAVETTKRILREM